MNYIPKYSMKPEYFIFEKSINNSGQELFQGKEVTEEFYNSYEGIKALKKRWTESAPSPIWEEFKAPNCEFDGEELKVTKNGFIDKWVLNKHVYGSISNVMSTTGICNILNKYFGSYDIK